MQLGSLDGCWRFEKPNRVENDGDERPERNGMLYRWFQFDCCGIHFHLLRLNCPVYLKPTLQPLPKLMVVYAFVVFGLITLGSPDSPACYLNEVNYQPLSYQIYAQPQ